MRLSSQSRFYLLLFALLAVLSVYAAFGGRDLVGDLGRLWADLFAPKTARTLYRKELLREGLIGDRDLELWDLAYDIAKGSPLRVSTPHREVISVDNQLVHSAQAFRVEVPAGRQLRIRARGESPRLFGELFRVDRGPAGKRPAASWTEERRELTYEPSTPDGAEMLFVVQAPPWQYSRYELEVTTAPVILFPVAGKDEGAIQSFWGAPRDGGRRRHEGNDIFAPRGTELLAPADGTVTRVNNGGLGGKTVWIYDADRDFRYYFAHLDEQLVSRGQRVRRGDVVGTVGNTGNARTTPPHLHFGVYANGAIDPYPFLRRPEEPPPPPALTLESPAAQLTVPRRGNHYLRLTPARDGTVIRPLENGETVTGLGVTGRFYRVQTGRNEIGYVNFD